MKPWMRASGRALALRLDRLSEAVRTAADRLRAALSRLLGDTVTETVRDLFRVLFEHSAVIGRPFSYPPGYESSPRPRPFRASYDEDDNLAPWLEDELSDPYEREFGRRPFYDDSAHDTGAAKQQEPRPMWSVAAEAGLRVFAWCLRRLPGRPGWLGGLAAGTAAAGVALYGGPWAVVSLRLSDTLALLAS